MRFSTSKTWMFLAGCAIAAAICAPSIAAPTAPIQPSQSSSDVKVKAGDEATPAPITYNTVDGIWEVQLQPAGGQAVYSHLNLLTQADSVGGKWTRGLQATPISGSQQGDRFSLTGSDAKGPFSMTGYIENSATMIGEVSQAGRLIAFTATHQGLPLNERPAKSRHAQRHHRKSEPQSIDIATPAPSS